MTFDCYFLCYPHITPRLLPFMGRLNLFNYFCFKSEGLLTPSNNETVQNRSLRVVTEISYYLLLSVMDTTCCFQPSKFSNLVESSHSEPIV